VVLVTHYVQLFYVVCVFYTILLMVAKFLCFPNGRYIDCLSLTYATNKGKMLKLHYKYKLKETFKINIIVLIIRS